MAQAVNSLAVLNTTSQLDLYTSGSFTPTANSWILALCNWSNTSISATPTGVGGGLTWSSIQDQNNYGTIASPAKGTGWFWAKAPSSPSSMTFGLDFGTGNLQTGCNISIIEDTGSTASSPKKQSKTNRADDGSGTISVTLDTAPASGSVTVVFVSSDINAAINPRSAWTEIDDGGYGTPAHRIESQYRLSGGEQTGSGAKASGTSALAITIIEIPETSGGGTITSGDGSLSGTGSLAGVGKTVLRAISTIAGIGVLAAVGKSLAKVSGSMAGVGTMVGGGKSIRGVTGTMAGSGTMVGVGSNANVPVGTMAGSSTMVGRGGSISKVTGSMAGVGTMVGVGSDAASPIAAFLAGIVPIRYVVGVIPNVVPVETVVTSEAGVVPVRVFVGPENVVPVREAPAETPRVKVRLS